MELLFAGPEEADIVSEINISECLINHHLINGETFKFLDTIEPLGKKT